MQVLFCSKIIVKQFLEITCTALNRARLKFELQSSRSVIPNRNDEPDPMAATRASGACSGIEPISSKIYHFVQKKKRSGGVGGGSPPPRAGRPPRAPEARAAPLPLSKLQSLLLLFLGTFIKIIS